MEPHLVSLYHEPHGGELAASVAEELVGQVLRELLLQPHRLEAREGRADPQVQFGAGVDGLAGPEVWGAIQ